MSRNNWLIVAALVLLIAAAVVLVNVRGVDAVFTGTPPRRPATASHDSGEVELSWNGDCEKYWVRRKFVGVE